MRRRADTPIGFVLAFGAVSLLADFVYEGARSVVGPFLAELGASAALVGVVTGAGEAVALVFRLVTGPLADRTGRRWGLSIAGYAITIVAVPLLALAQTLWQASALVIAERFGKAVRTPARDTMLADAGSSFGRGWAFAVHEALDQTGAVLGPLLVAAMIALSGYRLGFAVLAVPGVLMFFLLLRLRRAVPRPEIFRTGPEPVPGAAHRFDRRFWVYSAFTALSMAGFATFGLIGFHLATRKIVPDAQIPIVYALAMGTAAVAALGSGRAYDRFGLRSLVIAPVLAALASALLLGADDAWLGGAVWGLALGVHESTLRAAVPDLVPHDSLGAAYGVFTAVYGIAWLVGGALLGVVYGTSIAAAVWLSVGLQTVALALLLTGPFGRLDG
ncbi:MAG TPA: MFS transporter [Solirubrobacter sp.]|nr:MFS transporter [Solirubrobacter sp.]